MQSLSSIFQRHRKVKGHVQIPLRSLETLAFTLMKLDPVIKTSLFSPYNMTNVAREKGKVQID